MIYEITYQIRLWRLQQRQRKVERENDQQLSVLRRPPQDRDSIGEAESQALFDHQDFEGALDELQTDYIIHQIRRYHLAFPEAEDWEAKEPPFFYRRLKRASVVRLRGVIRLEQKERWEHWQRWLPVVTALTGLVGALVGLATVLK